MAGTNTPGPAPQPAPMNQPALEPGMMVVHGNRMEDLRALTVGWMQHHPLAPLENEVILVQSNGVAQWLKLALARNPGGSDGGMGIAAAIDVQLPARFLWQAYRAVLGSSAIPADSPFDKDALAWRIMGLLPSLLDGADFAPLAAYLEDDPDRRKRHQLSERLADLLDQYQVYRADWLREWSSGEDRLLDVHGNPRPLPPGQGWQPRLWRALVADIAAAPGSAASLSRAEVHARFLAAAQSLDRRPAGLPRRVIVFGISSLPAQTLHALAALSRFCQVLMFVHNPCQHYWGDIVTGKDLLKAARRRHPAKAGMPLDVDEAALHLHAHPLLAAWGRQGRDYIRLLDEFDDPERYRHRFQMEGLDPSLQRIDLFSAPDAPTLLGQLQEDILELRSLADTQACHGPVDAGNDTSIAFHVAHSTQREVEILHDQLLHHFNQDRSLQPRDVIVMVPDIDLYAPHVQAVFGQFDGSDPRHVPFTLADRRQRGREPLLIALEHLVALPDSRFAASEVLDLLDVPAIRQRFGIREDDVPALHRWIDGAGIRWGLNAAQRESLELPTGLEQNTWRFGLRRMLLGYAVGSGGEWQDIEPHDEIGGLEAALLGPLARLLEALEQSWESLQEPASPKDWGLRLRTLLKTFFLPADDQDTLLLTQLDYLLEQWETACEAAGFAEPLPLNVVREAWLGRLDQGGLSQRFMAGAVNFCTLMPMRAIPFKRVCLLGMNDGDYPRSQAAADFDLMARDYRPGDRSRREDDRYLFLEALLSAREQLYISWVGRSVRDNSERPPSVLVAQLRDHLDAGWRLASGDGALAAALTLEHPLQPFSPAYFEAGDPRYFSYAHEWLGRSARAGDQAAGAATLSMDPGSRLPPPEPLPTLTLDLLAQFLRNPVKAFFNRRLKVHFDGEGESLENAEPFGLNSLDEYQLGEFLMKAALNGKLEEAGKSLQRKGCLPMGGHGELILRKLAAPLPDLATRFEAAAADWPDLQPEPEPLVFSHGGLCLDDWLGGLRRNPAGDLAMVVSMARNVRKKKDLLHHRLLPQWVAHLSACAVGLRLTTVVVAADETLQLPPVAEETAKEALAALLSAWLAGMCAPLPVAPRTAFQWLARLPAGEEQAMASARQVYEGNDYQSRGECGYCSYLTRQYPDFESLCVDGEFGRWALALYQPFFALVQPTGDEPKARKRGSSA
ncbi:MAG: exodeoxyribonuclease subunit gamma [Rhodocyclaceae bacterium]|nr:exodeoxyribonuclease subunit gamma [Rhodocyclaceae bacterium]